jgi:hypothetical protein
MLARFSGVVRRMKRVSVRDVRVVSRLVMIVGVVMIRRMTMMLGRMLVMLGRLAMMLRALVILHRALLDAPRASSCGDPRAFVHGRAPGIVCLSLHSLSATNDQVTKTSRPRHAGPRDEIVARS